MSDSKNKNIKAQTIVSNGIESRGNKNRIDGLHLNKPHNLGILIITVLFHATLLLISWKSKEHELHIPTYTILIENEPAVNASVPPSQPPPAKVAIIEKDQVITTENTPEEIVVEEKKNEETPEVSQAVSVGTESGTGDSESSVQNGSAVGAADEVYSVVEDSPRFPGCESNLPRAQLKRCAEERLSQYLYRNIRYPDQAKLNGIQGKCIISFVVEKDGLITDARIINDIGSGCGAEALRVVNSMNQMYEKWVPGKQRGSPVRVQVNLPLTFKLF